MDVVRPAAWEDGAARPAVASADELAWRPVERPVEKADAVVLPGASEAAEHRAAAFRGGVAAYRLGSTAVAGRRRLRGERERGDRDGAGPHRVAE